MLSMSYSNGKVNWISQIFGNPGTASITATYRLEKKNTSGAYSLVGTWPGLSTTSALLDNSGSLTTAKGTYRLTVNATVTSNTGVVENVSDSLEKTFS
jgi:hypothetical protein